MTEFEQKLLKYCTPQQDGKVACKAFVIPRDPLIKLDWGNISEIKDNPEIKWIKAAIEEKKTLLVSRAMLKALLALPVVYLKTER